jgi:hypothetical protein
MGIDADSRRSILNKKIRRYLVGIKDSIINNRDWNRDIYICIDWLMVWNMNFIDFLFFHMNWECHHPN